MNEHKTWHMHRQDTGKAVMVPGPMTYAEYRKAVAKGDGRRRISTGYLPLDVALGGGLASELHVMGAETGTGKSAFMLSVAENIAAGGTHALYFSLEMSRAELISRGISSISFRGDNMEAVPFSDMLFWNYDAESGQFTKRQPEDYEAAAEAYFSSCGEHLHIIEGGMGGVSASDIAETAIRFREETGEPVAVFVDYLQILSPDAWKHSHDRKAKVDQSVVTLKTLASQYGIPVVALSSISRGMYHARVSTASFKESGDTEYTGGILLGWNWNGVTDCQDAGARSREMSACKERGWREVSIDILKHRNADAGGRVSFRYCPAYNTFLPAGESMAEQPGRPMTPRSVHTPSMVQEDCPDAAKPMIVA